MSIFEEYGAFKESLAFVYYGLIENNWPKNAVANTVLERNKLTQKCCCQYSFGAKQAENSW